MKVKELQQLLAQYQGDAEVKIFNAMKPNQHNIAEVKEIEHHNFVSLVFNDLEGKINTYPNNHEVRHNIALQALSYWAEFCGTFFIIGSLDREHSYGGNQLIAERERQLAKGKDSNQDDVYTDGELAQAAWAYENNSEAHWPVTWSPNDWKPGTEERNLEKAGALYMAEMERLNRRFKNIAAQLTEIQFGRRVFVSDERTEGVVLPQTEVLPDFTLNKPVRYTAPCNTCCKPIEGIKGFTVICNHCYATNHF